MIISHVVVWLFYWNMTGVSPVLHKSTDLICAFPAADTTTHFEPLSAPSSQHPLRKEAGQAALVAHKLYSTVSCRDTGYFWSEGGSRYDYEKTPQTGNHSARHPAALAFLALSRAEWTPVGDSAPNADGDQREESPIEQESHLLFNSGWPLPHRNLCTHQLWVTNKNLSPHPVGSGHPVVCKI